jgi:hypothetical protein
MFAAVGDLVFVLFEAGDDSSSAGLYASAKSLQIGCARGAGLRELGRIGLRG